MSQNSSSKKRSLDEQDSTAPAQKREKETTGAVEAAVEAGDSAPQRPVEETQLAESVPVDGSEESSDSSNSSGANSAKTSELQRRRPKEPIHVLVVDDSATVRKITKAQLEEAGYKVDLAANGEEAFEKYTSNHQGYYNIILLDIYMPVLDGVRLANIIRERESMANNDYHQIIIGLSAETRDITADIMDSCLLKPFDLESFETCVRLFRIH